jgi:E3 ubiquitin-protein ligase MGRN1
MTEAYGLNSNRTDSENSKECVICLTNEKDTITQPCKHVALCNSCAQIIMGGDKKCPVCR